MTQTVFGGGGGSGKHRWNAEPARQPSRLRRKAAMTWAQKGVATAIAIALIVLFCIVVWRYPTTTPVIAVCVTDYPAPLPPNAWAYEDGLAMGLLGNSAYLRPVYQVEVAGDKREAPKELIALESAPTAKDWLAALSMAVKAGVGNVGETQTVVLYLSLHGAIDDAGRPCLIPAARNGATHADLLNAGGWIPLADVLNTVEEQAGDSHVLLALDANRIDMQWDLGILSNPFAPSAAKEVENGGKPRKHVTVINSTGENQVGWASPEMRRSVFGFYLEHGLRGAADTEGNNDKFVTVAELLAYLQRHVNGFVSSQFGGSVQQTPELWPRPMSVEEQSKIRIVRCAEGYLTPQPPTQTKALARAQDTTVKAWLDRLQTELDQEGERAAWRLHPEAWAQFRADLLRLEQSLAAGSAYTAEVQDLFKKLSAYPLHRPVAEEEFSEAAVTLALQERFNPDFLEKFSAEVQQAFAAEIEAYANPQSAEASAPPAADASATTTPVADSSAAADAAAGADQKPATETGPTADEKAGETKKLAEQSDPVRTYFVWKWFTNASCSREDFDGVANALLPSGVSDIVTPLVELQWMRLLQRDIPEAQWPARAELIYTLSNLRDRSEKLAALFVANPKNEKEHLRLDLRVLSQLRSRLEAAEMRRRECEDLAFLNQLEASATKARDLLGEYKSLTELAIALDKAWTALDEMRAESPHLIAWKLRLQTYDGKPIWNADETRHLLGAITRLEATLTAPDAATMDATAAATTHVSNALSAAQDAFDDLASEYETEVDLVVTKSTTNKNDGHLRRVTALLSTPGLEGGQRAALLERRDDLAAEAVSKIASPTGPANAGSSLAMKPLDGAVLQELAAWSTGIPVSKLSEKTLRARFVAARTDENKSLVAAWSSNSDALRRGGELVRIDKQSRRLAAFAPLALENDKDTVAEPAEQLAWEDLAQFAAWQNQRVQDDFLGDVGPQFAETNRENDSRSATANYFDLAAQKLLAAQGKFAINREIKLAPATTPIKEALLSVASASREGLKRRQGAARHGFFPSEGALPSGHSRTAPGEVTFRGSDKLPRGLAAVWMREHDGLVRTPGNDPTLRTERAVGVAETPAPLKFEFQLARASGDGLWPNSYFRGHYWRSQWQMDNVGTPRIAVYEPEEIVAPRVQVVYPRGSQLAFSVILDCSGSMNDGKGGPDRMQPAKNALMAALGQLANEKRHWVSLRLFAHRFTFEEQERAAMLKRSDYFVAQEKARQQLGQPKSELKHPNEDVELIQRMSLFQAADLKRLGAKLAPVKANGGTPLYYSIAQALKEDRPLVPPGYRHHVLVITDGENMVYDKGVLTFRNEPNVRDNDAQPTVQEIIKLFKPGGQPLHGVQLDILAMIPRPKRGESSEIKILDEANLGVCSFDVTGASLIAELRKAIGLQDFRLVDDKDNPLSEKRQLGFPVELNASTPAPQERVVAEVIDSGAKSESFPLLGGEAIVLELTEKGDGLIHKKEIPDSNDRVEESAAFTAWASPADATKLAKDEDISFHVSIRHPDPTRYLAPPVEAWAEITIPQSDGKSLTYLAYDMKRLAKRPITVLEWTIHGHKLQRDEEANLRVWWRDRPASVLPAELRIAGLMTEKGMQPEGAPGLTLLGTLRENDDDMTLEIEESHDPPQGGFGENAMTHIPWRRIELVDQAENTLSITRAFYPKNGSAIHRFKLKKEAASTIQSARVRYSPLGRPSESSSSNGIQYAEFPAVKIPYLNQGSQ